MNKGTHRRLKIQKKYGKKVCKFIIYNLNKEKEPDYIQIMLAHKFEIVVSLKTIYNWKEDLIDNWFVTK